MVRATTAAERRQISIIGTIALVAILAFDIAAWATGHAQWPQFFVPAMLLCLMLAAWIAAKHPNAARRLIWGAVVLAIAGMIATGADLLGWIRA